MSEGEGEGEGDDLRVPLIVMGVIAAFFLLGLALLAASALLG